jgi:hypothetical protein
MPLALGTMLFLQLSFVRNLVARPVPIPKDKTIGAFDAA